MTAPLSRFLMHQKEKKRNKETATLTQKKKHLNSQPREETEDRHSLYGKKEIENESEKPEDKTSIFLKHQNNQRFICGKGGESGDLYLQVSLVLAAEDEIQNLK